MHPKTKIILAQLGSPKSTKVADVRSYLREFLGDPRVVDLPRALWAVILYLFVLPLRPFKSAQAYQRLWEKWGSFPLLTVTKSFTEKVDRILNEKSQGRVRAEHAFILSEPRVRHVLAKWRKAGKQEQQLLITPQFPQFSESTSSSVWDAFHQGSLKERELPHLEFMQSYHCSHAFINESVRQIEDFLQKHSIDALVISFHGIPKRRVLGENADPYYRHCGETFELIKSRLKSIDQTKIHQTFQSRFGSEEWLTPYTDKYVEDLVKSGHKKLAAYCPSFVVDCLETTDEIGTELGEEVEAWGGELTLIPCLNDKDSWCQAYAQFLLDFLARKPEDEYLYSTKEIHVPTAQMTKTPLPTESKQALKILFLILFIDLVGFSIIFPLFPSLVKFYLETDGNNIFLQGILNGLAWLSGTGKSISPIVLFGGVLGALYSFLQFLTAPFWGSLSDKVGRKPVFVISLIGLALSYLLWFFSGSFTLLIFARFLGGVMAGNISTATATVADVTSAENRSRGMATVGIAFAMGFIIGPALGGLLSKLNLLDFFPTWIQAGVNPFSMVALFAFLLCLFNLFLVWKKFKETLPAEKRGQGKKYRSRNPFKLLAPLPYKGANLVNYGHFLFLTLFSGMEFTLTFLAVERLSYTSLDNAYLFIFIGVLIALVQGGFVRRKANSIGEKKVALVGLVLLIPGLLLVSATSSSWILYSGLFFLACGAAMVIPCLTSLMSLYTPAENQGAALGVFRSLGALARVIGPLLAALVYWKWGSSYPYVLGAILLVIPLALISRLPKASS